jgi:hypothetical protein
MNDTNNSSAGAGGIEEYRRVYELVSYLEMVSKAEHLPRYI